MTAAAIIAAMTSAGGDTLLAALRRHFGHQDFRTGQREVVEAVVAGRDTVVVMPTGGGKSLCYQLPALLSPGATVVISPLIALMQDQVQALRARGIAAAALHSNLDGAEQRRVQLAYRQGELRLLYVAPERLVRSDFQTMLAESPPPRLVVDEAHCISEWGHDFRRDYLRIGEVAAALEPVQLVACTATATAEVRQDVVARLGMREPLAYVHGFARPNLQLAALRVRSEAEKLARLDEAIDPAGGHAIVYAGTRARAAALAARLGIRFPTMLYHGDLAAEERVRAQADFTSGRVRVAVTTSAFGMGVDVATVRQVIHVALPSSLEEYYQQAGRAGRDGMPARCLIIHAPADRRLQEFFIESAHPQPAVVAGVHRSLLLCGRDPGAWRLVAPRDPAVQTLSDAGGDAARGLLRDAGAIGADGHVDSRPAALDHARAAALRRHAYHRLERLIAYLQPNGCRHRRIQEHFGEAVIATGCASGCDVCAGADSLRTEAPVEDRVILQALSAVARLNDRVGTVRIAGVLTGSRGHTVVSIPGVAQLGVYGALAGWRETDVVELLRRLLDAGAVRQGAPPYATVALTALGAKALRGETRLDIGDPRSASPASRPAAASAPAAALTEPEAARFEHLRVWRRREASQRGVPAYVVLSDRTLTEIARRLPGDEADLLAVPGVGPAKLALYGAGLLGLVGELRDRADGRPAAAPA
jgi:ATP-dependent DNA helicase RecQ